MVHLNSESLVTKQRKSICDAEGNLDTDKVSPAVEHILRQHNPYMIVYCSTPAQLVTEVNDWALRGMTPTGGVMYDGKQYMQAMYYTSTKPIERRYQSRAIHNQPNVGTADEPPVRKRSTKRGATAKRPVQRGD